MVHKKRMRCLDGDLRVVVWWSVAQGQRCNHDFHLFSFYLKTNAENQILQGHIITKRNKRKHLQKVHHIIYIHQNPFVRIIEQPTHSCVLCVSVSACVRFVCLLMSICLQSRSNFPHPNQLLCFRKLVFFFFTFQWKSEHILLDKNTRKTPVGI